jgi:hypothetical protein
MYVVVVVEKFVKYCCLFVATQLESGVLFVVFLKTVFTSTDRRSA